MMYDYNEKKGYDQDSSDAKCFKARLEVKFLIEEDVGIWIYVLMCGS